MGVDNLETPLQAAPPPKPDPELPPPLPYDGAVRNLYPTPPAQIPTHPEAAPMHAYQPTVIDVPPERKRGCLSYCAAPVNPRTYAVLMYFLLWNLPWAMFAAFWVNFTFWMSIGTVPLCLVGIVFLAIFSWTWRAMCALEVSLINAICPPTSGRIERDELSFSPHLKNAVTWLSVPYFCFFKIIWAGMIFSFIGGLYALSIMFLLSPVYYWLGVGIECADCTGIWIVFVHVPAGCLLFWLTCVLTLLLGECEAQIIKALNQKKTSHHEFAAIGTSYTGYNEKTPMLAAAPAYAAYTPEKPTASQWVVPNTSLHLLVKNGSKGSRCCTAIGCTLCMIMTGFLFFLGITGIAAMHCGNVWGDDIDSVQVFSYDDKVGNDDWGAPIGIALDDSDQWWWNSWWGAVFNQGRIHITTDQTMDQSHVKYSVSVNNKRGRHSKNPLAHLVDSTVRDGILHVTKSGRYSYMERLRHCASFEVTMTVPTQPKWDYMPAMRVNGTNGFGVEASFTTEIWKALSELSIHTKNAWINLQSPYFNSNDYNFANLPSLPVTIETTNAHLRLDNILTSGSVYARTTNSHIDAETIIGGGDSQLITTNSRINVDRMYFTGNFSSNWTVSTKNDEIEISSAYFADDSVYKNALTLTTTNDDVHVRTYNYYGDYDIQTSKHEEADLWMSRNPGPINDRSINENWHKSGTLYKRKGYSPITPTRHTFNDLTIRTRNDRIQWRWDERDY